MKSEETKARCRTKYTFAEAHELTRMYISSIFCRGAFDLNERKREREIENRSAHCHFAIRDV